MGREGDGSPKNFRLPPLYEGRGNSLKITTCRKERDKSPNRQEENDLKRKAKFRGVSEKKGGEKPDERGGITVIYVKEKKGEIAPEAPSLSKKTFVQQKAITVVLLFPGIRQRKKDTVHKGRKKKRGDSSNWGKRTLLEGEKIGEGPCPEHLGRNDPMQSSISMRFLGEGENKPCANSLGEAIIAAKGRGSSSSCREDGRPSPTGGSYCFRWPVLSPGEGKRNPWFSRGGGQRNPDTHLPLTKKRRIEAAFEIPRESGSSKKKRVPGLVIKNFFQRNPYRGRRRGCGGRIDVTGGGHRLAFGGELSGMKGRGGVRWVMTAERKRGKGSRIFRGNLHTRRGAPVAGERGKKPSAIPPACGLGDRFQKEKKRLLRCLQGGTRRGQRDSTQKKGSAIRPSLSG